MLGLHHFDVPNLRGRNVKDVPNDHTRGREVAADRDTESEDEFDFRLAEEAEHGSAEEESESGHKGSSRKKKLKPTNRGGDEAIKGEKTEDELETANSNERENRSKEAESVRMFDSDTRNQPRAKRKRGQQKKRQHRDNKGAEKGHVSRQADQKGQSVRTQTGRGARRRRGARRNRSGDPEDHEEPQVELEGGVLRDKLNIGRIS